MSTPHAAPVSIILDTDMGNDIDDALALAMLHALQSRGESRLLGVTVCKDNPHAPAFVDLVNTFYRRGRIPVGVVHDGVTPDDGPYTLPVISQRNDNGSPRFPRTRNDYLDAVATLRRLLADEPDGSVTLVMIGFSTNLARLLDTPPDSISDLDGRTLVERKLSHVVMMAGEFSPHVLADPGTKLEYNVVQDIASAQRFVAGCPVPIVFTGLEVGRSIPYPGESIERDFAWTAHHPVAEAYRAYKPMPYDRPTWDLTAVLYAVRPEHGYFGVSQPGVAKVDDRGALHFVTDAAGPCRYLSVDDAQRSRVYEAQVELVTQPTDGTPRPAVRRTLPPLRQPVRVVTDSN